MSAGPAAHLTRPRTPYENWRPPIVGVTVLVRVGADELLAVDTTGMGNLMLPTGSMETGQTPEEGACQSLLGLSPDLVHTVGTDMVQTRRRLVVVHLAVTDDLSPRDALRLVYRDPRASLYALPITQLVKALSCTGRSRALTALGCR